MNAKHAVIFLVISGIIILGIALLANNSYKNNPSNFGHITDPLTLPTEYTLTEVGTHAESEDCWTIVRTNVYDLTAWIAKHPGGEKAILGICGKDATAVFETQHGGQENPEKALESFKIGNYKK